MRDIIRRGIMLLGRPEAVGGCASSGPLGSGSVKKNTIAVHCFST